MSLNPIHLPGYTAFHLTLYTILFPNKIWVIHTFGGVICQIVVYSGNDREEISAPRDLDRFLREMNSLNSIITCHSNIPSKEKTEKLRIYMENII